LSIADSFPASYKKLILRIWVFVFEWSFVLKEKTKSVTNSAEVAQS